MAAMSPVVVLAPTPAIALQAFAHHSPVRKAKSVSKRVRTECVPLDSHVARTTAFPVCPVVLVVVPVVPVVPVVLAVAKVAQADWIMDKVVLAAALVALVALAAAKVALVVARVALAVARAALVAAKVALVAAVPTQALLSVQHSYNA
jgi:hypothetical protein